MKKILFTLCCSLFILASCKSDEPSSSTPSVEPDPREESLTKANTMVVYECNERLFAQTNAFRAIQNYLPALQQMQVNVLWLMPIHPRGTKNAFGSPYCVKDYYAVDPAFGTMDDLKALVNDAHNRGMKVILDWIANHTAYDNDLYIHHPEYYTSPVGEEKNWNDVVPLDYNNTAVRTYMKEAMVYWVQNADIDGFRCDYAEGCPREFWTDAISAIREVKNDAILLAEASDTKLYTAGFDWLYSWNYLGAVQEVFKGSKQLSSLYSASSGELSSTPDGKERLRYTTTHDASSENAPSTFYKNANGELAAACLTFFLAGVPMIYSSQEIGDMGQINFSNYNLKDFSSANVTRDAYTALMKAYVATAEARYGELKDYSVGDKKVAMFTKVQKGEKKDKQLLVIVNTSNAEQTVTLPIDYQRNKYLNPLTGDSVFSPKSQTLQPYEYKIYTH